MKELQRQLSADGYDNITCISLHPGLVVTPASLSLFDNAIPYLGWLIGWLVRRLALDEVQGAWPLAFAAAGVKVHNDREKYKAAYLTWWEQIEIPTAQARSETLAKELWQTSELVLQELKI
jgi:hypothetical protein